MQVIKSTKQQYALVWDECGTSEVGVELVMAVTWADSIEEATKTFLSTDLAEQADLDSGQHYVRTSMVEVIITD